MNFINTCIEDTYMIQETRREDDRGSFNKIFNAEFFQNNKFDIKIKETYYTVSKKNVIRGMHFQIPPYEHEKIVTVIKGSITDIIFDLRKSSKTYGKFLEYNLNDKTNEAIYIPKGCAHGFKSLEDGTTMLYLTTSEYNSKCDSGIRWDSIGYDWNLKDAIISDRDSKFIEFKDFISPF